MKKIIAILMLAALPALAQNFNYCVAGGGKASYWTRY